MKTKTTITIVIGIAFALTLAINIIAKASDSVDLGVCTVTKTANTKDTAGHYIAGSLAAMIEDGYNYGWDGQYDPSGQTCYQEINFASGITEVTITEPITLRQTGNSEYLTINGGGIKINNAMEADSTQAMFIIDGSNMVKFDGLTFTGNSAISIKCLDASDVELTGITIDNTSPTTALSFEGCSNIKLTDVQVKNSAAGATDAVIDIKGSSSVPVVDSVELSTVTLGPDGTQGIGVKINSASNVSVNSIIANNHNGTVLDLFAIAELKKMNVTATTVESGIVMNDIANNSTSYTYSATLIGNGENNGTGLKLDEGVSQMTFEGLNISGFGGNGILVTDSCNYNTFNNITVHSNLNYGISFEGYAQHNKITSGSSFYYNSNCGINLASGAEMTMIETEVDTFANQNGCAIDGPSELDVATDALQIFPTGENQIYVDFDRDAYAGDKTLDLHRTDNGTSGTDLDNQMISLSLNSSPNKGTKGVLKGVLSKFGNKLIKKSIADTQYQTISATSSGGLTNSYITSFEIDKLPLPYSTTLDENYFALIKNADGYVIGIWKGVASSDGNYNDSTGYTTDENCYQDPTDTSSLQRIYSEKDSDGDTIPDWEEDADHNCVVNGTETNPYDADSFDDDGMNDYCEQKFGADHNNPDSDADGLKDGEEDANGNCVQDANETSPMDSDQDDDGLLDGKEAMYGTDPFDNDTDDDDLLDGPETDKCPLIKGDCYYDYCMVGVDTGLDFDNDGIGDYKEDADHDCVYDLGTELRADSTDTDGDGISDDKEDTNLNGQHDEGETDGTKADTDGDCIQDGKEDKNFDGEFDLSAQETDPTVMDSDLDGINDGGEGGEDVSCDGVLDDGETKPYINDTDGDGVGDAEDVCPWNKDQNCVVRYCNINNFDNIDTDADGLPDVKEDFNGDCAWTQSGKEPNPLIYDTDADGLNDSIEVDCFGTNPTTADTDGDGRSDYDEVDNSIAQCKPMYNLGDTDPLNAEFGCALDITKHATNGGNMTIILLGVLGLLLNMRLHKLATQND